MRSAFLAAAIFVAAVTSSAIGQAARAQVDPPCDTVLDADELEALVNQCLEVSPATRPPCNGANSCEMITDEIQRGCAMIAEPERPAFCAGFVE